MSKDPAPASSEIEPMPPDCRTQAWPRQGATTLSPGILLVVDETAGVRITRCTASPPPPATVRRDTAPRGEMPMTMRPVRGDGDRLFSTYHSPLPPSHSRETGNLRFGRRALRL